MTDRASPNGTGKPRRASIYRGHRRFIGDALNKFSAYDIRYGCFIIGKSTTMLSVPQASSQAQDT